MNCTVYSWRQSLSRQAGSTSPPLQPLLLTHEVLSFGHAFRHRPPLSSALLCTVICSSGLLEAHCFAFTGKGAVPWLYSHSGHTWVTYRMTQQGMPAPGFAIKWQEVPPMHSWLWADWIVSPYPAGSHTSQNYGQGKLCAITLSLCSSQISLRLFKPRKKTACILY